MSVVMEEVLSRHREERKDLHAKVTQKKKSASKKTRKGVNDECERLEYELQTRQAAEIAALHDNTDVNRPTEAQSSSDDGLVDLEEVKEESSSPQPAIETLSLENDVSAPQTRKPNRAKARLARRAAEQARMMDEAAAEAEHAPNLAAQEKERLDAILKSRGLTEHEIRPDGHCLYAATADQIRHKGRDVRVGSVTSFTEDYRTVRYVAADFIENHPDDYSAFLEEDLDIYVDKIRDTGEWGGQIELMALSKAYGVIICVVHGDGNVIEIGDSSEDNKIWLAYYRHGFGLGEHYNSLRSKGS